MRLMDKLRSDPRERDVREREALERESQRQARDLEERHREERERQRSRMSTADIAERATARVMPDERSTARVMPDGRDREAPAARREPARRGEPPTGQLRDTDVEDAVEVARRDGRTARGDGHAADVPADANMAEHARRTDTPVTRAADPRTGDGRAAEARAAADPHAGDARRADERMADSRMAQPQQRAAHADEPLAALFHADVAQGFRSRWDAAQIGFVDDPRRAVRQADELVAEVMKTLAQSFADERRQLEAQMNETASTENLRVALQRYRSFFQRLLSL